MNQSVVIQRMHTVSNIKHIKEKFANFSGRKSSKTTNFGEKHDKIPYL